MTFCIWIFKGDVIDANTSQPIENATVTIQGNTKTVGTTQNGEFWRLLTPGYYNISASAFGYNQSPWIQVLVSENDAIYHQIELERVSLVIESSTESTEFTPGSTESTTGSIESGSRSTESSTGSIESPTEGIESSTGVTESTKESTESSTGSPGSTSVNTQFPTGSTESIEEPILEVVD